MPLTVHSTCLAPAEHAAFLREIRVRCPELEREELNSAFRRFKELADTRKAVTLTDVFEEVTVR